MVVRPLQARKGAKDVGRGFKPNFANGLAFFCLTRERPSLPYAAQQGLRGAPDSIKFDEISIPRAHERIGSRALAPGSRVGREGDPWVDQ